MASNNSKTYVMILDGFGEGKDYEGNSITKAHMPNLSKLKAKYPSTLLKSSGNAVGLPEGTQGGSEVGHFTIGAGRIIFQSLEEINRSITDKSFFTKKPFMDAVEKVTKNPHASLHLLGMLSDQGVHSHMNHLFALLDLAVLYKVPKVYIHIITDGRDVPERTAQEFIKRLQEKLKNLSAHQETDIRVASIIGRYYAMDRDNNWDRTAKAYDLYTLGKGVQESDPLLAIQNAYQRDITTDYYIDPITLDPNGLIKNEDAVIFWNYRTDRTKQITQCFTGESPLGFTPQKTVKPFFVCFGDYSTTAPVVFPTPQVRNNLGSVIEEAGLTQLRIAETEKYAHVTYFFNSQIEEPFPHEKRILVNSPKVPSYAQQPQMSAREVTQEVLKALEEEDYNLIVQNFANPDLVGHSGDLPATIQACQVIDECIGKITTKALEKGYDFMLTSDHGNAEYMIYPNGEPCPSHTTNPVIFLLASEKYKDATLASGKGLQDIAPTILQVMGIPKPPDMSGTSLIN